MSKTRQERIDDTITFVRHHVPEAERVSVQNYLTIRANGYGNVHLRAALSDDMSIGGSGESLERAARRACILLAALLDNDGRPGWFKGLAIRRLMVEGSKLIYRIRLLADQNSNAVHLLQTTFQTMQADPETFLKLHRLRTPCNNVTVGPVNVQPFHFYYDPTPMNNQFKIESGAPINMPGAYQFFAISVPAVDWKAVPQRTANTHNGTFANISATQLTGQTVMCTPQFSGCSFCLKRHAGTLYAAHVSPSNLPMIGEMRGPTLLARQLAGQEPPVVAGNFANAQGGNDAFRVYGAGYANFGGGAGYPVKIDAEDYMVLLGFFTGSWTFYSQHGTAGRIKDVERFIYA